MADQTQVDAARVELQRTLQCIGPSLEGSATPEIYVRISALLVRRALDILGGPTS